MNTRPSLPVLELDCLPPLAIFEHPGVGVPVYARGYAGNVSIQYYYCPHCGGFINGFPYEHMLRHIWELTGRFGTVWLCRRCGCEVGCISLYE